MQRNNAQLKSMLLEIKVWVKNSSLKRREKTPNEFAFLRFIYFTLLRMMKN